jgi:hypothetical protein
MKYIDGRISAFVVVCAFALSACGGPRPAEISRGKKLIIERHGGPQVVQLVAFKQTDARIYEALGAKVFAIQFTAELEYLTPCVAGLLRSGCEPVTGKTVMYYGEVLRKPGDRVSLEGALCFVNTSKGWQFSHLAASGSDCPYGSIY